MKYLNVGCGSTPTPGWTNYDNSISLRIARYPIVVSLLRSLGLLSRAQLEYIDFARQHPELRWADARRHIPEPDQSADVLYSSHMLEHLDPEEARGFLSEARRVLKPNGILRISVPDLRIGVDRYVEHGDANVLLDWLAIVPPQERGLRASIRRWVVGSRHHKWMYDGPSLCSLLRDVGFADPTVAAPATTRIPSPGELDLSQRAEDSVFVEATRA